MEAYATMLRKAEPHLRKMPRLWPPGSRHFRPQVARFRKCLRRRKHTNLGLWRRNAMLSDTAARLSCSASGFSREAEFEFCLCGQEFRDASGVLAEIIDAADSLDRAFGDLIAIVFVVR